jgi:putative ABC transport system permease protein
MILARTTGDPNAAAPALRNIVRDLDPALALQGVQPLSSILVEMTAQRRLNTILLTVFGVVAALLAAVGIYGLIAYSVAQRTRELGVRIALGASATRVMRLVAGEGLVLATIGVVLGLGAALLLGRSMGTMLYGVSATDPVTFAAIAAVAALTAITASLVPAMRALRIDPSRSLAAGDQ